MKYNVWPILFSLFRVSGNSENIKVQEAKYCTQPDVRGYIGVFLW